MKKNYIFIAALSLLLSMSQFSAQTTWTGPMTTFTKTNNADWTLEANQDRITDNVWITRANNQGIFNIVTESSYADFSSPADTEWAIGTTANIGSLMFQNWEDTSGSNPPSLVNQDMVVHLITDDIYIDIKFLSWQSGGAGGGFSYERSTDQNLGTETFEFNERLKLRPNPASTYVKISGLRNSEYYTIYNVLGAKVKSGRISNDEAINIEGFTDGLYLLKLDNGHSLKFVKQ
ncbi:MAG: T9SS type A sorting domain-containing protein [Bacteroidota bacterium]